MDDVILDLGYDVNILSKKTWEQMGKPKLFWSPIQLRLENQYKIYPIGHMEKVEINLDDLRVQHILKLLRLYMRLILTQRWSVLVRHLLTIQF